MFPEHTLQSGWTRSSGPIYRAPVNLCPRLPPFLPSETDLFTWEGISLFLAVPKSTTPPPFFKNNFWPIPPPPTVTAENAQGPASRACCCLMPGGGSAAQWHELGHWTWLQFWVIHCTFLTTWVFFNVWCVTYIPKSVYSIHTEGIASAWSIFTNWTHLCQDAEHSKCSPESSLASPSSYQFPSKGSQQPDF